MKRRKIIPILTICLMILGSLGSYTWADTVDPVEEAGNTVITDTVSTKAAAELTDAGGTLKSGEYVLNDDVILNNNITIDTGNTVTIDLNGRTLTGTGSGSVIVVSNGATLTIEDSKGNGKITGGGGDYGGGIYVNGNLTMDGGVISGNSAVDAGGGVYVSGSGTFTMNGGKITENTATSSAEGKGVGGGVVNTGIFTMRGTAKLYDNTAENAADDFYNGKENEDGTGLNIVIDGSWDQNHNMGLESLSVSDSDNVARTTTNGTFTLREASTYGFDAWYEDKNVDRYDTSSEYEVKENDTSEQYLTVGGTPGEQLWYYEVYYHFFNPDTRKWEWILYKDGQGGWAYPYETVAISHEDFDGEELWDSIDGSGPETLGVHYVFDEDNESNRLSADACDATEDNPLKIYYDATSHFIEYEYEGDVPENAPEAPERVESQYSLIEEVEEIPSIPGYTFVGWTTGDIHDDCWLDDEENEGEFYMPNNDVKFTGKWIKDITVTPVDLTIYMGGNAYEGTVVDEDSGGLISENKEDAGFPEPGFTVDLPDELKDVNITDLEFKEKDGDKTWKFEPYDGNEGTEVYKLVPQGENQEPTRVQFELDGELLISDEFNAAELINQTVEMSLYKGSVGDIVVEHSDTTYNVDSSSASNLTVRGTTSGEKYADVAEPAGFEPEAGEPGLTAPEGTKYTINDGSVEVKDGDVALLFDGILDTADGSRTELLKTKAAESFESQSDTRQFEFRYLDLVDKNNGNVWVKADKEVTVYWPLPAETDKDTEFTLLHFSGLNRSIDAGDIAEEIEKCNVEKITPIKVSDTHISFEIGSGGFSPFVLVWDTDEGTGGGGGGGTDPGEEPGVDPDPNPDPDKPGIEEPDNPDVENPDNPDEEEPENPGTDEPGAEDPDEDEPAIDEPSTDKPGDKPSAGDEGTVDAENPDNQEPVKTGDVSNIALWCSILTAAFAAAASMALYRRKHTKN